MVEEAPFAVLPPPKNLARVEQRFIQFFPRAPFPSHPSPVSLSERKPLLISRKRKSNGRYLHIYNRYLPTKLKGILVF